MEAVNWVGGFLIDAIKVALVLGFIIFIHELGHFIVAKKVGIKVHEFALGFGQKLFSIVKGETTYSIRLIPMGGFVKMEGEEEDSDDERAFNKKSIPQRLAVIFAGPFMNILFAVLILFTFVMYSGQYVSSQIDKVIPNTGAATSGIMPGDKIIKINDKTVRIWDDINWYMMQAGKSDIKVTVKRNNEIKNFIVKATMFLNFKVNSSNTISEIAQNSGLAKLGLKTGDKIKSINGTPVNAPEQTEKVIRENDSKLIVFGIEEGNKIIEKKFDAPLVKRYIIGIEPIQKAGNVNELIYYSSLKSIFLIKIMMISIYDLFTGNISLNQVMGPVGIITEISSQKLIIDLLWLAAIISLNLGIVNLIPFPPLDGGKILTLGIEAVRRKPIKPENEAMISLIGFSLLILLLIVVTFNDIVRFTGAG